MAQTAEVYTTTLSLPKGTVMSKFISDRTIDVHHDPVAGMIFGHLSENETVIQDDFAVEIVKLPLSEFDINQDMGVVVAGLKDRGLAPIHEYFAVLLWHQDSDILQLDEGALVLTGVIEHAMMGKHIFSISRYGGVRQVDYVAIHSHSGIVMPRRPVQWVICARKKYKQPK